MTERLVRQHGDVLLFLIDGDLAPNLKRVVPKNGRHILADGEATGHAHVICDLENCNLYADEKGTLFVEAKAPVELTHEEHAKQTIEPGNYRIGQVREVDPFADEVRAVAD